MIIHPVAATCCWPNQLAHTPAPVRRSLQRDVNANALQSCCRWCVYAMPKSIRSFAHRTMVLLHNNGVRRALSVTINCPVNLYLSISWPFPVPAGKSFVRRRNNKWQKEARFITLIQWWPSGSLSFLLYLTLSLAISFLFQDEFRFACVRESFSEILPSVRVHIKFVCLACAAQTNTIRKKRQPGTMQHRLWGIICV